MGCFLSPQIIHPGQAHRQPIKESRKAIIMKSKTNLESVYCCSSRQNLSSVTQNINQIRQPINGQALVLVEKAISRHFLFYGLNQNQRHQLIKLMKRYSVFKNYYIFRKGDIATTFFIIISGRVQIQTGLQMHTFLQKGQSFGQLALIYDAPRSVSVVAKQQTILWGIQTHVFNQFMKRIKQKNYNYIRSFLDKVSFFSFLSESQKQNLVMNSHKFKYQLGSKIFSIKDPSNSIFIVIEGRIQMDIPNKPKVLFEKGEMFGQGCLLGDQFRSGTAWCIQQTVCLSISKNTLLKQLGVQANNILLYCICKWALKRSSIFNLLKRTIIDKIIFSGQMKIIEHGQIIQQKGKPTKKLYICLQGKINNKGVGSIYNQLPEQSGSIDLIKNGKGYIFNIQLSLLTRILNRPLKTFVQTKQKRVKIKTQHMQTIDDFIILQKLEENYINEKIIVTTHSQPKQKYLLHCLKKVNITEAKEENRIKKYIKNLKLITNNKRQHSLVPKIVKIFNDKHYLFIVKQYTGNILLSQLIHQPQHFSILSNNSLFYWACIIDIISHLHTFNIIHNNINSHSFVLGQNGYLYSDELFYMKNLTIQLNQLKKSTKYQVRQKQMKQGKKKKKNTKNFMFKTSTISDLPHYLAPEVISGQGNGIQSDLWSLGVLLYQILYGELPYGANSSDVMQIYANILNNEVQFPIKSSINQQSIYQQQIICSLLKIQENQRMSLLKIKQLQYFRQQKVSNTNQQQEIDKNLSNYFKRLNKFEIKAPNIEITNKKNNNQNNCHSYSYLNDYLAVQRKVFGDQTSQTFQYLDF